MKSPFVINITGREDIVSALLNQLSIAVEVVELMFESRQMQLACRRRRPSNHAI